MSIPLGIILGTLLALILCVLTGLCIGLSRQNKKIDYTLICSCRGTDFDSSGEFIVCMDCGKKYLK